MENNLSINPKEYIWSEKYRPKNIDDIVLPEEQKQTIRTWLEDEEVPNLLLSGRIPGTGKTSLCHVLISEIGADALFVNASLESNIDTLRNKIQGFVSTASFDGNPKIVVLDEADFLNPNSTQPALRGFIEKFSKNARFILTCNYKNKLIEPLRNRLIEIDYDEMYQNNKPELLKQTLYRTVAILKNEQVEYDNESLKWILQHLYPSSRRIISALQEYSTSGVLKINKEEIDQDSLSQEIINNIIKKDFNALSKGIQKLPDPSSLFGVVFERIEEFPVAVRPKMIITIAKYQAWDSSVRDRTINCIAAAVELMELQ